MSKAKHPAMMILLTQSHMTNVLVFLGTSNPFDLPCANMFNYLKYNFVGTPREFIITNL